MWLFNLLFSALSQLWYFEVRISRSISVSPLDFEIMIVDCINRYPSLWANSAHDKLILTFFLFSDETDWDISRNSTEKICMKR